ncbi:MAG: PIG-L family deacetylase [Paludibacteraceae bacterium]|nr:PIG-L family deacetylase [Paludibacteraceae bacterium]
MQLSAVRPIKNLYKLPKMPLFFLLFVLTIFLGNFHTVQAACGCPDGVTVNIVAHQDDDLLFLNPDISNDINEGKCVVTIFTTAGDANNNSDYWLSRELGVKSAYATMSDVANTWSKSIYLADNHSIPVFTLNENPTVSLVFLRLPDGNYNGSGFLNNNYESLQKLWEGSISEIHAVDNSTYYSKQELIDTIANLLNHFEPDIIRTQNYRDDYNFNADHSDHYSTAYFTHSASQQYQKSHVLLGYLGYEISSLPINLFGVDFTDKKTFFMDYTPYDYLVCAPQTTCWNNNYGLWLERQYSFNTQFTSTESELNSTRVLLADNGWNLSGNNGSDEKDIQIPADSLLDMKYVEVQFDLHGTSFGIGSDEASIIFIQDSAWYAANIIPYAENGIEGVQTVNIPLQELYKIGDVSTTLDLTDSVSNLHARFWNSDDFSVDILSVKLKDESSDDEGGSDEGVDEGTGASDGEGEDDGDGEGVSTDSTADTEPAVDPTIELDSTADSTIETDSTGDSTVETDLEDDQTATDYLELLDSAWSFSGSDGSAEEDTQIPQNSIENMEFIKVMFDLSGTSFGYGDDEASIIFVQDNEWYGVNLVLYGDNGLNEPQSVVIPLSAFHKIGDVANKLDLTKAVTNLHGRFWNENTFNVNVSNVVLISAAESESEPTTDLADEPTVEPESVGEPEPEPTTEPADESEPETTTEQADESESVIDPEPTSEPEAESETQPGTSDNGELLVDDTWNFTGSNGSEEEDMQISTDTLKDKQKVKIIFNLKGYTFGTGDDEASIIFIQDNEWYAVNLIAYAENGKDGEQTIEIDLSDFHKVGDSSEKLDLSKAVSNLHARFWNSGTFNVEIYSVRVLED